MSRPCRYPCDCDQFDDEHCACMDGHENDGAQSSTILADLHAQSALDDAARLTEQLGRETT